MAPTDSLQSYGVAELYQSLPLKLENSIRLVRIVPFTAIGLVQCDLLVAHLQESPNYTALSYTWGPSTNQEADAGVNGDPIQEILCDRYPLKVTANLYHFLQQASRDASIHGRLLWIDFLSINQADESERSQQVSLMASIYNSAESVLVWLGEEDATTASAFELLRRLGQCSKAELSLIRPHTLQHDGVLALISPSNGMDHWNSLRSFFQRRYFTRVWVIQEITLAREGSSTTVLCGVHTIDWMSLVRISRFLTTTSWTRWLSPGGLLPESNPLHSHHGVPTLLNANKRAMVSNDSNILLYSLIRSRRFVASDPRDKVYALLGIAGQSVLGKPRYAPVYTNRTAEETYISVAIQILEDSTDLFLLTAAEGEVFRHMPLLPTWVPDWSYARVVGLGITGYTRFNAAGSVPRSLEINEDERSLQVRGLKLDTIIHAGESKSDVLRGAHFPIWLNILNTMPAIYHTGEARLDVLWRTLCTNTAEYPPVYPATPEFFKAFRAWISIRLSFARSASGKVAMEILQLQSMESSHEDENLFTAHDFEAVFSHALHLRLFLTSQNLLGLGSESLGVGDSVWIIHGVRVPLVLRQTIAGHFQVVGGAYVHGFMDGEALSKGFAVQDITIV